jgi:ABC-2 type transport system permease protein
LPSMKAMDAKEQWTMNSALLRKSMRDLRGQIIGWGLGMGGLLLLTVALYPSISEAYSEVWDQLPENFLAFMGVDAALDTIEGYLNAEFFSYAPIAIAVFAIMAGTAVLAGEENSGTLDLLMAQPIGRLRVLIVKLVALTAATGILLSIVLAILWVSILAFNINAPAGRIINAFILLWPFEVAVAFLAVLLTQFFPSRVLVGTIMAVVLVASYILDALSNLEPALADFRPLFLTAYYQGSHALTGDISWGYTGGLLAILVASVALIIPLFMRRDLAVGRPFSLKSLRMGRKAAEQGST